MMRSKALALTASAVLFVAGLSLPRIFAQEPPPATPPPEQDPQVTLELNRGQRPPMKLAIPPFRGTQTLSGAAAGAAREMEQTVRRDLESSGYFEIIGPDRIGAVTWSGNMQRDVEPFRALGAETLLLGDIRAEGDRIIFEGRLFDIASAQPILAKRYRGSATVSRRIGHTFADEVIRYLVGRPGISLSSI